MQSDSVVPPPAAVREALIENVPIVIGRMDAQGVVQETEGSIPNSAVLGGIDPGRTNLLEVFPEEADEIRAALDGGHARIHVQAANGSGQAAHFELRFEFDRRRGSGAYFLVHDVTETRRLQLALLDCTDREQMRVGQDLHDTIGQSLAGIAYQLQALQQHLPSDAIGRFWKLQENVAGCLSQTRNIAFTLSPQFAGEEVGGAFERLCAHMRETFETDCAFTAKLERRIAGSGLAFHLFRIAQEACTNAVRHASPKRIEIRLRTGVENILEIEDDGRGLSGNGTPGIPGTGIPMMKFRAQAMGGSLRLLPREAGGTVVRCRFENKYAPDADPHGNHQPCPTCP